MRIWDLPPSRLCRAHLLGEHRELHAIWSILTSGKKGYSRHPETRRWSGKLKALYLRHGKLVLEMERRGYSHRSPLEEKYAKGMAFQDEFLEVPGKQLLILKRKKCGCRV